MPLRSGRARARLLFDDESTVAIGNSPNSTNEDPDEPVVKIEPGEAQAAAVGDESPAKPVVVPPDVQAVIGLVDRLDTSWPIRACRKSSRHPRTRVH
jgi:hypothetical protein